MVFKQIIYNARGQETGAILTTVFSDPISRELKIIVEKQLVEYAFTTLYPGQGLNIYSDINADTPAITVVRNINGLQSKEIKI